MIEQIKREYNCFYREILKNGFLTKATTLGVWGVTDINAVFGLFQDIDLKKFKNFIDLGSGDGCVCAVASIFTKTTGVEIDDELIEHARKISKEIGLQINFLKKDFFEHDIKDYDAVFVNPDTAFFRGLEQKLLKELKGILIVGGVFRPQQLKKIKEINGFGIYLIESSNGFESFC